jgi:predicted RNA-binding protein YlqC (UPF0109 family)
MPKRVAQIASSLKQLGDIQVSEWDFMGLLNTELRELEISRSLRRFGNIKVIDWDYGTVLPTVKKTADQEVDLAKLLRRAANCKVMEWDFRSVLPGDAKPAELPGPKAAAADEMQTISLRLKNFLQFVAVSLIDEPNHAQIKVSEMSPTCLRFKLVLVKKDVAMLIGREGHTAAAIRSILKATAEMHGLQALLQIHSHEEEAALLAKESARK